MLKEYISLPEYAKKYQMSQDAIKQIILSENI